MQLPDSFSPRLPTAAQVGSGCREELLFLIPKGAGHAPN